MIIAEQNNRYSLYYVIFAINKANDIVENTSDELKKASYFERMRIKN